MTIFAISIYISGIVLVVVWTAAFEGQMDFQDALSNGILWPVFLLCGIIAGIVIAVGWIVTSPIKYLFNKVRGEPLR